MHRRDAIAIITGVMLLCRQNQAPAQELPPSPPPAAPPMAPGVDDRDYLLRRQQEIFRLSVETDYALALQKLCQTGYGDPRLCHGSPPNPPVTPTKLANDAQAVALKPRQDLPVVQEISGLGSALSVILRYDDGRIVTVPASAAGQGGVLLPGGETVVKVEPRQVVIKRPGGAISTLSLPGDMSVGPTAPPAAGRP